jgi:hypothetical protein
MNRRRATIPQRKPVFLGCEGQSEQAYGELLNDLLRQNDHHFYLDTVNLNPGAGDPVSRIRRAQQEIARISRTRSEFYLKLILMDSDQVANDVARQREAERLAEQFNIRVIWQEPCHEALLLRHLDGCSDRRPPTSAAAMEALRSEWPEYRKPMTRVGLARRIALDGVHRAATVERMLYDFLRDIRLLP